MTALKWIVTEAKKLKKKFPKRFSTWKEYVAQASAIYAKKHKGKSPVGKKKAKVGYSSLRKKADKELTKAIKSEPKTLFPYTKKQTLVMAAKKHYDKLNKDIHKISGVKKKASKKTPAKSYHKDTKSHNVNIRVMSGLGTYDNPERILYEIEFWQKQLDKLRNEYKSEKGKMYKHSITTDIRLAKKWLEVNKTKLKKVLSKIK